jgi:glycosyltransferase involved in cell wall biosynthesis
VNGPLRCAVLPPAAVPYREPLFTALGSRDDLQLRVIYGTRQLAGWDVGTDWLSTEHAYDAVFLRALQRPRTGRSPVMLTRGVWPALDGFDPDVVVMWEFGPTALLARAWCARRGRAAVHFSELGEAAVRAVARPQRALHRALARRAAAAIGASTQARDRLIAIGADRARTVVSLQSVDADAIRAAAASRVRSERSGPLRLLCVARLVPDKNIGALIDAVTDGVELHVVGDGPLQDELMARAAARCAVRFTASVTPAVLAGIYAEADALALVSLHEPFGVALREGVAAGLPLIASSRAGATGDVAVAGQNAIVVDPEDERAIAAAVAVMARDRPLRERMAEASREIDAQWPLSRSVDGFARAIELGYEFSSAGSTRARRASTARSQR